MGPRMTQKPYPNILRRFFLDKSFKQITYFLIEQHIGFFLQFIPGPVGFLMRWCFYKLMCQQLGSSVYIYPNSKIYHSYGLKIGRNVTMEDVYIDARGGVKIGNDVMLAQDVIILTSSHSTQRSAVPIIARPIIFKPVEIGDDCWIGCRVVILPGVKIGRGCVIGAGSVVTKDVKDYSVAYGVPAKVEREMGEG